MLYLIENEETGARQFVEAGTVSAALAGHPSHVVVSDPAEIDAEERKNAMILLRQQRDHRLAASDPYMLPDRPLTDAQRTAWVAYRQALRDMPETADPYAPTWPAAPTSE
jgi:hypothetical protein